VQFLVKRLHFPGAELGDADKLEDGLWELAAQVFEKAHSARGGQFFDALLHDAIDAIDFAQALLFDDEFDVAVEFEDGFCGICIGGDFEGFFVCQFH